MEEEEQMRPLLTAVSSTCWSRRRLTTPPRSVRRAAGPSRGVVPDMAPVGPWSSGGGPLSVPLSVPLFVPLSVPLSVQLFVQLFVPLCFTSNEPRCCQEVMVVMSKLPGTHPEGSVVLGSQSYRETGERY